jgi:predicted nucleic acid-binding protein
MGYLFDASSLILLIKRVDEDSFLRFREKIRMLDLTLYEVGNTLWKEGSLRGVLKEDEAKSLMRYARIVLGSVPRVGITADDFEGVYEVAHNSKLSYYDAAYLYTARKSKLTLVTEDHKLLEAAHDVKVARLQDLKF